MGAGNYQSPKMPRISFLLFFCTLLSVWLQRVFCHWELLDPFPYLILYRNLRSHELSTCYHSFDAPELVKPTWAFGGLDLLEGPWTGRGTAAES